MREAFFVIRCFFDIELLLEVVFLCVPKVMRMLFSPHTSYEETTISMKKQAAHEFAQKDYIESDSDVKLVYSVTFPRCGIQHG